MNAEFLKICERAARKGGQVLREKLGNAWVREKRRADLVTEADFASQETIREIVLNAFPAHAFLGEENENNVAQTEISEYRWIVDPLDGTTNFVHGVPLFATSVALVHGKDVLCGTIYNPILEECFTAAAGCGAFLNGKAIRASQTADLADSLAAVSFPTTTRFDSPDLLAFMKLVPLAQAIRRTGSTAINMAYLAAGRFDVLTCYGAHAWDVAAGAILICEAGGILAAPDGGAFDIDKPQTLAASTESLYRQVLRILNENE
ncbi:MAG: inositol monophosphatase [Planctomycetaceae bacterium]|jgi:myo-inositol-1(or 4)-monophosphatase|nr:inositol monophosphatase [Planctomycetaceae bacterium]